MTPDNRIQRHNVCEYKVKKMRRIDGIKCADGIKVSQIKGKTKPMFPLIQETINIFVRKKRKVYEKGCHQVAYCYQAK